MTTKTIFNPVYEIEFTEQEVETCSDFLNLIKNIQHELVTHNAGINTTLVFGCDDDVDFDNEITNQKETTIWNPEILAHFIECYGKLKFTISDRRH